MFDDARWGDDPRDRDGDGGPHLGRGPSSRDEKAEPDRRDHDDERWPDRDRDSRQRDPRDVFMRDLNLPRGREREIVYDPRDREYTLRGSETRTLSTVGAFRVVSARDLRDHLDRAADPRQGDLRHLREQGLIATVRLDGRRDVAVSSQTVGATCWRHTETATRTLVRSSTRASNASASSNMTLRFTRRI